MAGLLGDDLVVTLKEFKEHLRIPSENDLLDGSLTIYLKAAIKSSEHFTGMSFTAENMGDDIKAAILMMAGRLYTNPTDTVDSMPTASKNLLRPYRSWGVTE